MLFNLQPLLQLLTLSGLGMVDILCLESLVQDIHHLTTQVEEENGKSPQRHFSHKSKRETFYQFSQFNITFCC